MAINDYSTLRTAVSGSAKASWSHRADILQNFDDFLQLMQEEMYRGVPEIPGAQGLRIREMEQRSTASLSTSSRFLQLPDDYLEPRRAELEYTDANALTTVYPLKYVVPSLLVQQYGSGRPSCFTITSQYEFDITPDIAYTIEDQFYNKITDLSSSNTTHTILTKFPSIFLYGCLYEAFKWAQNFEKANYYGSLFQNSINAANEQDEWGIGPAPQMIMVGPIP